MPEEFQNDSESKKLLAPQDYFSVIRAARFARMLGICHASLYLRLNAKSKYFDARAPQRVKLGRRAVGFYLGEVLDYIQCLAREQ